MELSRRDQNSQFATQRVIQGSALEKVEDKIFKAYVEPHGSSLYQQLRDGSSVSLSLIPSESHDVAV